MYQYIPRGVCARAINIDLDGDVIKHVEFIGGCNGNLKAISKLIQGKSVDEIAPILEGNTCGGKSTSCADQLVRGLRAVQEAQKQEA